MSTSYITLTRQTGLLSEMSVIAHNISNMHTTGFRREGIIFSEFIRNGGDITSDSISMAAARGRMTDFSQAILTQTGGDFDFAIEGSGFFQVETDDGIRLTRAGAFTPNEAGELVTPDGNRVLDAGGAPIFIPFDARSIALSKDGTLSADGQPISQIGLVEPADPTAMTRQSGVLLNPGGETVPVEGATLLQGYVEGSNVNPIWEISRMIQVQRAYEMGQRFLEAEGERKDSVLRTLTQ